MYYYYHIFIVHLILFIQFIYCNKYLLPDNVKPYLYDLIIYTTLDEGTDSDFTFNGQESIIINVLKPTNKIVLHAKNLQIGKVSVEPFEVIATKYQEELDFLHIFLNKQLDVNNNYTVNIEFSGIINSDFNAYYRSSYKRDDKDVWLAVTKLEPTFAREAFPCFDEPALKAQYKISLGHLKTYSSISNMPLEESVEMGDDYVLDIFQVSVPMSTYLVAYMVSDLGYVSSPSGLSNTEFRIWARNDSLSQTTFAATTAPKALTFFEDYFHIPYPLPKQDMVAVPDFSSGAMENWGLITCRESSLLYDSKVSLRKHKQNIARVICHELAHQWFGNLVTMQWWNDLWLNEGFATYMAVLCVDDLFPEWEYAERSFRGIMNDVWVPDGFQSSIPLSADVTNPGNIQELFGAVAYKKGSSILKMLESSLGSDVLKKGVTHYLNKFKYKNARQEDLWNSLNYAAHEALVIPDDLDITTMMNSWTLQTGYPILHVKRNYTTNSVILTQERFMWNSKNNESNKYCYWIPFTYTTETLPNFEDTTPDLWIPCPRKEVYYKNFANSDEWIISNIKQTGLYRVNYDTKNWNLLKNQLSENANVFDTLSRQSMVQDLTALTEIGKITYKFTFDFLKYLNYESSKLPWLIALNFLEGIALKLQRSKGYSKILEYLQYILKHKYKNSRLIEPNSNVKLFAPLACKYGVDTCLEDADYLLRKYMQNPIKYDIFKEYRPIVFCYGIKHGNIKAWNFLWALYLNSSVEVERNMLLKCLSCSNDEYILEKYVNEIFGTRVRKQHIPLIFRNVANNEVGYEIARDLLYEKGEKFLPRSRKIHTFLSVITAPIIDYQEKDMFIEFINRNQWIKQFADLAVKRSEEKIQTNIEWFIKNYYKVLDAIK